VGVFTESSMGGGDGPREATQKVVLEIWAPGRQGFWESKWLASALVAGTPTRLNSIRDRCSVDTDLATWLEWKGGSPPYEVFASYSTRITSFNG
jgi:hypothetical protein